ncbi:MAG: outer membrane beta-barrel domain-containing protein [Chitinophagaceae bacterium]|nr:MAG: outer membrane beta-barrel domain-containing protein [Chitinophagaceae bacterium]
MNRKFIASLSVFALLLTIYSSCSRIDTTDIGNGLIPVVDNVNTFDTTYDVITDNFLFNDSSRIFDNEDHALGFFYEKNAAGLSKYGEQLKEVPSANGGSTQLDFTRAPAPDSTMMVDYNFKAFYGKMSLSKSVVFNLSTLGTLGAGMVKYANKAYPGIALGLGQKYYMTNNFSLRADLRLFMNNAPIPFYKSNGTGTGIEKANKAPTYDQFSERLTYTTNIDVGVNYMF